MLQQAQSFGYDVLKTTASVMAVDMTAKPVIKKAIPKDLVAGAYASDGVMYALSSDIVDYFTEGSSKLLDGQYFNFADDALYFGLLSGAVDQTDVGVMMYDQIRNVVPLSQDMNIALTNGLVVSGGRVVMQMVDTNPNTPDVIKMVRRPLTTIASRVA